MFRTDRPSSASGFTLVEVLIAVAIFITLSVGVAQLIAVATRAVRAARERTSAAILAGAKMEQLRSLAWTYFPPEPGDPALARSDRTTDVSHPAHASNGAGLQASPVGTLGSNTPPYVDYVDGAGRWVGTWQRSAAKRRLHQAMGGATPCDRSGADARPAGPRDDGSR